MPKEKQLSDLSEIVRWALFTFTGDPPRANRWRFRKVLAMGAERAGELARRLVEEGFAVEAIEGRNRTLYLTRRGIEARERATEEIENLVPAPF